MHRLLPTRRIATAGTDSYLHKPGDRLLHHGHPPPGMLSLHSSDSNLTQLTPPKMVWSARISLTKKVGLFVMFSGGLITAIFGGLRCGYILQDSEQGPQLAGEWSCRESFVAVFISNFPILFPFMHRAWLRSRFGTSNKNSSGGLTPAAGNTKNSGAFKLSSLSGKGGGKKGNKFKHPLSLPGETFYDRFGSEEEIIENKEGVGKKDSPKAEDDIKITPEWRVQSQEVDARALERERRERITAGYHAQ